MKYRVDIYDKQLMVWRPTGLLFDDKNEAIGKMDKTFFKKGKKSYRTIANNKEVVAQRLFILELE